MKKRSAISSQRSALGHQPSACRAELDVASSIRQSRKATRGFTLIELLTVIAVIGILIGITIGTLQHARLKTQISRTRAEIAAMEAAIENFKADNGFWQWSTTDRDNATTNSACLFHALSGGPKKYITFQSKQLVDGANVLILTTNCGSFSANFTVTNVVVRDPFGRPYNYFLDVCGSGHSNSFGYDLWSYGPDGTNNTSDDIGNWRR